MPVIQRRRGVGTLVSKGTDIGTVAYDLVVSRTPRFIDGGGTLDGEHTVLSAGLQAPNGLKLRFEDAAEVEIVINRLGTGGCHFLTSGVIPGVNVEGM